MNVNYAQTHDENLNKYWKYRDRLRKDFTRFGNENGNNIPMCARAIGFAYSGVPLNDENLKPTDMVIHGNSAVEIGHTINQSSNQNHYYYSSGIVSLEGSDSHLSFLKGQLHIPANTTFQPIHPNGPSGYIEFRGADDHELITGTNSIFKIVGDGPNDVMLKMNGYADLWNANFGMGTIVLQDCILSLSTTY